MIYQSQNIISNDNHLFIGYNTYRQEYFNGIIDEVRIWNVARTAEQIQANINTTLTGQEEGLVGYWNFDDGTAKDLSGNGNDGTLFGDTQIVERELPGDFIPAGISVIFLEDKIANPDDQFTVDISGHLAEKLPEGAKRSFHCFSFDLTFDPDLLRAVRVKEGYLLNCEGVDATFWQTPMLDNKNGIISNIRCSRTGEEGVRKKDTLATVIFEACDMGYTCLNIQNLHLLSPMEEEINASTIKGKIKVYPHGNISGMVLDEESREPVKDARVEIWKDYFAFGLQTYSADDGTYTINGVPAGDFDVTASRYDYLAGTILKVHVEGGKNTRDINIKIGYFPMASTISIPTPLPMSEVAPDFSQKSLDGKTIKLSDFKGEVVILNFWATWG